MINTKRTILFEQVSPADFDEILSLESISFNEYDMMNRDDLDWYLEKYGSGFYKIMEAGSFAGYILFFIDDGEGYMESIAIDRKFRGRGIADMAVDFMISRLKSENVPVLKLHVRSENKAAIALYEKHGFVFMGTEEGIYADGSSACVYSRPLM
ncbi:MAG TPA: N-acetyltransferase [Spirochaetota bacterium]|nr:N-acetyltransferase [Spirochaetota bacterium]